MRPSTRTSRIRGGQPVEPALGWTYFSREALLCAKSQMDEESMGVRDEIGFLTIHHRNPTMTHAIRPTTRSSEEARVN